MRKLIIVALVFAICLIVPGTMAEEEPERVMEFIAVMDLNCGKALGKDECAALTDIVIEELVKAKIYTVIDRANRDKILEEVGFQQTGCVDESCSVEAGRLLGVGKLVVGKITKFGSIYIVNLQLVNVQTGAVEASATEECKCELEGLLQSVRNAARKLMGQAPVPTPYGETQPPPQPTGPKGGEMVKVPAGEFSMGSDSRKANAKPVHKVYLDEFYIDKYEVTNAQYQQCVSAGACSSNKKYNGFTGPQQPVVGVDWSQANTFCKWAGKRLPTEAEWEKAARGTDGRTYPWGEGIDCTKANYSKCGQKTKPVGSYPSGASPYGAMDMAGNVWEWTADWYDKKYYSNSPNRNPTGPSSGEYRVLRGGSWSLAPLLLRSSYRYRYRPDYGGYFYVGHRCARTL